MMAPVDQAVVSFVNSNGKEETIPALDPRRMQIRGFIKYAPPLMDNDTFSSPADEMHLFDDWKERMFYIVEDINWLLKLPHDLFWCQVIFDTTLHQLLDSFLMYAPRYYDNALVKDYCKEIHTKVCKFVFLTIIRMSANEESKENCISPAVFGEIIYENFIFDIPKLFDVCSILYGKDRRNRDILTKVIRNIFEKQPKYYDDLEAALSTIFQTIDQMCQKLGFKSESALNAPVKLDSRTDGSLSAEELKDIILYLYDTGNTLRAFLATFPSASEIFQRNDAFARLALVIDSILPEVIDRLNGEDDQVWYIHCNQTSTVLLEVCHLILRHTFLGKPDLSGVDDVSQRKLEGYVQTVSSALSNKRFLYNYDKEYSIKSEFEALTDGSACVDDTPITFILDAVETARKAFDHVQAVENKDEAQGNVPHCVSQDIIQQTVVRLKDLFPDLADEFLERAAHHYSGNEHVIVNAILEETLPPELNNDNLARSSVPQNTNKSSNASPARSNQDDKTTVAESSVGNLPAGRYHRKEYRRSDDDVMTILTDKDQARYVREYMYNLEEKASRFDEYDDEYDDTYDSQNVGAIDADSADELDDIIKRRAFVTPRVLRRPGEQSEEEPQDETQDQEGSDRDKGRNSSSNNKVPQADKQSTNSRFPDSDKSKYQRHSGKSDRNKVKDGKSDTRAKDTRLTGRGDKSEGKGAKENKYSQKDNRHGKSAGRNRDGAKAFEGGDWKRDSNQDNGKRGTNYIDNERTVGNRDRLGAEGRSSGGRGSNSRDSSNRNRNMNGVDGYEEEGVNRRGVVLAGNQKSSDEDDFVERNPNTSIDRNEGNTASWHGRGTSRGRGRGKGDGRPTGSGRGRGKWHDKHHRKDKAAQKFSRGMGPLPRD